MSEKFEMKEVNDDVLATVSGGTNTVGSPAPEDFTVSGVCRMCEQRRKLNTSQLCYDCACHVQRRAG